MTTTGERPTTYSGFALYSGWSLWRDYLAQYPAHPPCTDETPCAYCRMTPAEIEAYKRKIRGQYGLKEEYGYTPENEND